jgi:hypothetical protein
LLALSDEELAIVRRAAEPLDRRLRNRFLLAATRSPNPNSIRTLSCQIYTAFFWPSVTTKRLILTSPRPSLVQLREQPIAARAIAGLTQEVVA